jgi:Zn-dependent M28 family amino/carboxypeptidase
VIRVVRSALRVLVATVGVLALVATGACAILTQPGLRRSPLPEGARAHAATLRRHVEFLTRDAHPRSFRDTVNLDAAAAYIRAALESAGAKVTEQDYVVEGRRFRNVVGRLGPATGQRLVLGAHYDAFGGLPGADDNASGVAGLLELARLLGERGATRPIELVAYSTEEPPYFGGEQMGSSVHARSLATAQVEVEAMINLEMIGYFSERQPSPSFLFRWLYPSRGDFVVVAGRYADRRLVRQVMSGIRGTAGRVRVRGYTGPTGLGSDLSDHRNYWAVGIPAVMVTDTAFVRNRNYHQAGDTADTLDYERMAEVVDGVAAFVLR